MVLIVFFSGRNLAKIRYSLDCACVVNYYKTVNKDAILAFRKVFICWEPPWGDLKSYRVRTCMAV